VGKRGGKRFRDRIFGRRKSNEETAIYVMQLSARIFATILITGTGGGNVNGARIPDAPDYHLSDAYNLAKLRLMEYEDYELPLQHDLTMTREIASTNWWGHIIKRGMGADQCFQYMLKSAGKKYRITNLSVSSYASTINSLIVLSNLLPHNDLRTNRDFILSELYFLAAQGTLGSLTQDERIHINNLFRDALTNAIINVSLNRKWSLETMEKVWKTLDELEGVIKKNDAWGSVKSIGRRATNRKKKYYGYFPY